MMNNSENNAFHETVGTSLRQPLAGGVSNRQWFVALVKFHYEEICRKQLQEKGYEAYVACQKEMHVYRNRHRREVTRIIIPNLVFVRIDEGERLQILKEFPSIKCFLTDKASRPNQYGRHPFAVIPAPQMERLQFMLHHADTPVNFIAQPAYRLGDHIRVVRGPLAGFEGQVARDGNSTYLVVTLDLLGSAMTTISPDDLEKIA